MVDDRRISRIVVGILLGTALTFAFVGLSFSIRAQDKPADRPADHTTLPAPMHSDGEISNVQSSPLTFMFNGDTLVECEKGGFKTPPSECHLMKGHSLDDFMAAIIETEQMRDCTLKPAKEKVTNETYSAVPCDVQWNNNDHSSCDKCCGSGRVPIVSAQTRDQFLQWFVGSLLVLILALTIIAAASR